MNDNFTNTRIQLILSNHVLLAVFEERAFVLEGATFKHVFISGRQNGNHEIEHQDVNEEQIDDLKNREYDRRQPFRSVHVVICAQSCVVSSGH